MKRRTFLSAVGGAIGVSSGCAEVLSDDEESPNASGRSNVTTSAVPTNRSGTVPDIDSVEVTVEEITVEEVTMDVPTVEVTVKEVTVDVPTVEGNDVTSIDPPSIETPTVNVTEIGEGACDGDAEDVEVIEHTLSPAPGEAYFVEGTVRNTGSESVCPIVVLAVNYPDGRRETDTFRVGGLLGTGTAEFILGPIELSDVDPESVGYRIYITAQPQPADETSSKSG